MNKLTWVMGMQTQKTDTHISMHTHKFVSEIGEAEADDIHTQIGMTVMDIQWYFRQSKRKVFQAI